jgi:S-DNA-T family DNA segregation ATPase FtsK/SpoIIIE
VLDAHLALAKGDRNREKLLKPLLEVGVVPIDGGAPAAVVAPWHPMRLAATWRKSHLAIKLVTQILDSETPEGDAKLFFRDIEQDFKHPLYPELAIIWTEDGPQLLCVSDAVADYSLHESPVFDLNGHNDTNESPAEGSACVLDLLRRYIALHPHERANMSVVLYNCDSARLPQAVVERVGGIQDDDEEVRCQVLLRHTDGQKLREVYRSILSADTTADVYSASEATQFHGAPADLSDRRRNVAARSQGWLPLRHRVLVGRDLEARPARMVSGKCRPGRSSNAPTLALVAPSPGRPRRFEVSRLPVLPGPKR